MMYEDTRRYNAVGYEYKEITVPRKMESVYADGYANFGWEFNGTDHAPQGEIDVILKFKRDRQLRNKTELNRLERQFESGLSEIGRLERKNSAVVMGAALGAGIVGTAFSAGAVFSFIADKIALGIILLIPSIAGWAFGYFSSIRLKAKQSAQTAPQIDQRYDEVYAVCQRAHDLLAQG